MNEKKPVTIKDIARQLDVSHTTVSLALRNHPSLPAATRARIQKLARELGYRPNPLVHALMAHVRAAQPVKSTTTAGALYTLP